MYGIKVLFCDFISWAKKQVMFYIAILAALVWFGFWFSSIFAGTETFPVGYWQKVPFGIVVACVGLGCAFFWIKLTRPQSWDKLDDETDGGVSALDEWQRVKVSLFWVSIFVVAYLIGILAL